MQSVAVAGEKSAALLGEILKTKPFEKVLERQIFAERHEMNFVVDRGNRAGVVDDVDRIVDAGFRGVVGIGKPHGAGDQHGALRAARFVICGERIGFARQKERKGRFRPDQMRRVVHALGLRT